MAPFLFPIFLPKIGFGGWYHVYVHYIDTYISVCVHTPYFSPSKLPNLMQM